MGDQMPALDNGTTCDPVPPVLEALSSRYPDVHKYLATFVCSLGVTTNLVNIAVFAQPSMRNPTNTLLTALAISDCLMSTVYLPFCLYFTMNNRLKLDCPEPLPWQLFLWAQLCVTIFAHACSSWITVALATFRLVYIELPVRSKQLCTGRTARLAIGLAGAASLCMVVPNALGHHVVPTDPETVALRLQSCRLEINASYYTFGLKFSQDSVLSSLNFWIMGIGIKFLPVLLLTVLSIFLIKSLKRTDERRRTLRSGAKLTTPDGKQQQAAANDDKQTTRTTKLLITIVLVSVVSIMPQAIMFFLLGSSSNKNCFSKRFYDPLGDVFDLMTLFNHSINFFFYYGMSEQFRQALAALLAIPCRPLAARLQRRRRREQRPRQSTNSEARYAPVSANGAADDGPHPADVVEIEDGLKLAETDF